MKKIILILFVFCIGCTHLSAPVQAVVIPVTSTPTQISTVQSTPIPPTASPTVTPDVGLPYTGYWLKLSKNILDHGGQTMQVIYQEGFDLTVVAEFCVRDGDFKTSTGFYFLAEDRWALYSTAPGGYDQTIFPYNFVYKYGSGNYYIHPAPWNTKGTDGCPKTAGGGCINMRWADFDAFHNGGEYVNPLTKETKQIPAIKVGTPFVILEKDVACTYLGDCLKNYACTDFHDCFVKYTCEKCKDPEEKWRNMISQKELP